jgi:hypothetical protein
MANMEYSKKTKSSMYDKYVKETPKFCSYLWELRFGELLDELRKYV